MEEIVQALREQGVLTDLRRVGTAHHDVGAHGRAPIPTDLHIPPTVQAVLASRIDRLPAEEKELLQTLAVIGKEFSLGLLKQVVDRSEDTMQRLLSHLQAAEFIYEQPAFPEPEYTFKHALTQEVAYNSLLLERRRVLHERAARAIEVLFQYRLEEHYSELAHHYSRSGNTEKAVDYLHLAGQQAVQRSANTEAVNHLTTALELFKTLPDTPKRTQQELTLQISLGPALMASKGYSAPEVEKAYARARELCQQIGETSQLFPILRGLLGFYLNRGELQTARELGEQLLSLAQRQQASALLMEAHYTLGLTFFFLGEMVSVREHTKQSLTLYDPQQHYTLASVEDPRMACLSFAALALWFLGYPDQALRRIHEALDLARELSHSYNLAFALHFAAWLHQFRREGRAAQERAEAAITLSTDQGFPFWVALGTSLRGWALAEQGQGEEGIAQIRQGLDAFRATGADTVRPQNLALLAEAYGKGGQAEEGLTLLVEALAAVEQSRERWWEAELYRLKGELTLQGKVQGSKFKAQGPEAEAEGCFHKAIELARRQSAKSLELRAVMSLGRLWQHQGRTEEARQMLADIYGWFTEGFDTPDLQEARALLAELESQAQRGRGGQKASRRKAASKATVRAAKTKNP